MAQGSERIQLLVQLTGGPPMLTCNAVPRFTSCLPASHAGHVLSVNRWARHAIHLATLHFGQVGVGVLSIRTPLRVAESEPTTVLNGSQWLRSERESSSLTGDGSGRRQVRGCSIWKGLSSYPLH
jgi:hypothetical protein